MLSFALMYLSPSDPAERMLTAQGVPAAPEVLQTMRMKMGLDQPFLTQYVNWMGNIVYGNMGISYMTGRPVFTELSIHLPHTIALALSSITLTLVLSIPLGLLAAIKQNKVTDYGIRFCTFIGTSIPGFFLSLLLIFLFAIKLRVLPVLGDNTVTSIILPTVTLSVGMASKYIRQIRAAVLEELEKDYVQGARSRGVKEGVILYSHVLKNAMLTIVTMIGLSIGSLMGGTTIVESIFVWPGVGKLVIDAIAQRDYPLIQGYVVWMALIFVVINLLTDLSYRLLDPRVRLSRDVA